MVDTLAAAGVKYADGYTGWAPGMAVSALAAGDAGGEAGESITGSDDYMTSAAVASGGPKLSGVASAEDAVVGSESPDGGADSVAGA